MDCSTPGFPVLHYLLEFAQIHVHWISDAIQPSHPLSTPSPPTFNLSQHQGLFHWVSSSYHVAKYWTFSFNISPSNDYSGPISFTMHWWDLLALQGTIKTEKETQMYRTDFWTLWEKVRVEWSERIALKHVYYQLWNRSPVQVWCMRQVLRAGALGWLRGCNGEGGGRKDRDGEHM